MRLQFSSIEKRWEQSITLSCSMVEQMVGQSEAKSVSCVWKVEVQRGWKEGLGLAGLGQTANSTFETHASRVSTARKPAQRASSLWWKPSYTAVDQRARFAAPRPRKRACRASSIRRPYRVVHLHVDSTTHETIP